MNRVDSTDSERQIVLVVDDEADIRSVLTLRLERAGYEVVSARDGQEGVDLAQEKLPDIILMDVRMPHMSGLQATEALRANPATAKIPVVLLTASVRDDAVEEGFAAGADDYIKKPFSPPELLTRIQAILGRR